MCDRIRGADKARLLDGVGRVRDIADAADGAVMLLTD